MGGTETVFSDCSGERTSAVQINTIGKGSLITPLLAVQVLEFQDGYPECAKSSASTFRHYAGVQAIVNSLGGVHGVSKTTHELIHMVFSEFASTDLTTVMLIGEQPTFPLDVWGTTDKRAV
jgi:hypothetical protein